MNGWMKGGGDGSGLRQSMKYEASGFCYVNDIVLAILELLKYVHMCGCMYICMYVFVLVGTSGWTSVHMKGSIVGWLHG